MPSAYESLLFISAATSSLELILLPVIASKYPPCESTSFASSSALLIMPMVLMAYLPNRETIKRGWGSVSLMQPIAALPLISVRTRSNLVRKGAFSML